jgi:hypothetical protein
LKLIHVSHHQQELKQTKQGPYSTGKCARHPIFNTRFDFSEKYCNWLRNYINIHNWPKQCPSGKKMEIRSIAEFSRPNFSNNFVAISAHFDGD